MKASDVRKGQVVRVKNLADDLGPVLVLVEPRYIETRQDVGALGAVFSIAPVGDRDLDDPHGCVVFVEHEAGEFPAAYLPWELDLLGEPVGRP